MPVYLPPEMWDKIFAHHALSAYAPNPSLASLCHLSSFFLPLARRHLYFEAELLSHSYLSYSDEAQAHPGLFPLVARSAALLATLEEHPHLRGFVQKARIGGIPRLSADAVPVWQAPEETLSCLLRFCPSLTNWWIGADVLECSPGIVDVRA
ncbi:hypothetical protein JCM8097_008309 [Rhodosporidiobolus ruineniae]